MKNLSLEQQLCYRGEDTVAKGYVGYSWLSYRGGLRTSRGRRRSGRSSAGRKRGRWRRGQARERAEAPLPKVPLICAGCIQILSLLIAVLRFPAAIEARSQLLLLNNI